MKTRQKVIATAATLVSAVFAVMMFVGYAIYHVADVGGNLMSIGSFLKSLHDAGTVSLGAVILVVFGLLGAGAVIMAIWKLGPFKAVALQAGSESPPIGIPNGKLATPMGDIALKAFGLLKSITFQCTNERTTNPQFECICYVTFFGLSPTDISPSQLKLGFINLGPELARLDLIVGQKCPGGVRYRGEGSWSALMEAVKKTMRWSPSPTSGPTPPWQKFPPTEMLECDIDINVPDGPVGIAHAASDVKLGFELQGSTNTIVTIKLLPWSTLDQKPAISLTLL
jgi:hypothetical protein